MSHVFFKDEIPSNKFFYATLQSQLQACAESKIAISCARNMRRAIYNSGRVYTDIEFEYMNGAIKNNVDTITKLYNKNISALVLLILAGYAKFDININGKIFGDQNSFIEELILVFSKPLRSLQELIIGMHIYNRGKIEIPSIEKASEKEFDPIKIAQSIFKFMLDIIEVGKYFTISILQGDFVVSSRYHDMPLMIVSVEHVLNNS